MRYSNATRAPIVRRRLAVPVLLAGLALTVPATIAHAQAPPIIPPAGALAPLTAPPIERVLPKAQPEIVPPAAPAAEAPAPPPAGGPVEVDKIRIDGVTVYDNAKLEAGYADAVGPAVPRARLDQIVQELQTRYLDDGYILTLVHGAFERSGKTVIFVIRATEGYISDIKLDGDIGPAGSLVYGILNHLVGRKPVNNSDLERYLLLANDIPGVTVQAVMRRGSGEAGAVELVARQSRKKFSGLANFDNRGPKEAGPPEILLSGSTNSFTSLGERLQASIFNTFNKEQIFGEVDGDTFLNSEGLRLHVYFGRGSNVPGGILTATGFNGILEIGGGKVTYPVIRSRRLNLYVDADLDDYQSTITLAVGGGTTMTGTHLLIERSGLAVDYQDSLVPGFAAANALNLKVSHGISGTSNERPQNAIHFNKVSGDLTRVQDLWSFGDVRTALKLAVGGQFSNDILPPSERFFLGGTRFGRGFFNGEAVGDRAVGTTVEAQFNTHLHGLPFTGENFKLPVQYYGFWDFGRGYNLAPSDISFTLNSAGIGVRSDLTEWLFLELEGVHRLTTHPQGAAVATQAGYAFFTRLTAHY